MARAPEIMHRALNLRRSILSPSQPMPGLKSILVTEKAPTKPAAMTVYCLPSSESEGTGAPADRNQTISGAIRKEAPAWTMLRKPVAITRSQ